VEEAKLLPKAVVRIVARILLVAFTLFSVDASVWADAFTDALGSGNSMGQSAIGSFSPQNLTQTLQNRGLNTTAESLTPQIDQGQASRGQYESYYTNPGAMSSASSDIGDFVHNSYQTRTVYDLSQDPTFGNKCLETDTEGKCTMWSSSKSMIKNSYPDCEEVKIPIYDDNPTEATCTGTRNTETVDCTVKTYTRIEQEIIDTMCSEQNIGYKPGQIYAVCKDYYDYWKIYVGQEEWRDDCYYGNNPHPAGDLSPEYYTSGVPSGAEYLGRRIPYNWDGCREESGFDYGTWSLYDWYKKYRHSVIERTYLDHDSPCGDMSQFALCILSKLEQCDPAGNNCVVRVNEGVDTGESITPPAPQLCNSYSGSIENYTLCMNNNLVLNSHTLTTAQDISSSGGLVRAYGGPEIPTSQWYQNGWYLKVQYSCSDITDTCQPLRDQGCRLYSQTCADPNDLECPIVNYTYHCGGTGGILGYDDAIVCDGNIRCMGSECKDTSYEGNKDFSKMAQVAEIMNALRMDSTNAIIFPGKAQSCQVGPIYCCNANTGGVSLFQYVLAMRSAQELYSVMSTGWSASVQAVAETTATTFNTLGANVGMATVSTETVGSSTITHIASSFGSTTVITTPVEAGAGAASTMSVSTSSLATPLMYELATMASVVGVIIAAYTIATTVYQLVFACKEEDMTTSISLGFNLCHFVGEHKEGDFLGMKLKTRNVYCCFNSILARLVHEQGRPQVHRGWGSPEQPDCGGFTIGEFASLDFSAMNLSEYMQYVQSKTNLSPAEMESIQKRALTSAGIGEQ